MMKVVDALLILVTRVGIHSFVKCNFVARSLTRVVTSFCYTQPSSSSLKEKNKETLFF